MGKVFDAFKEGKRPARVPSITETIHTVARLPARYIGVIGSSFCDPIEDKMYPPPIPIKIPNVAPIIPISKDSVRKRDKMSTFFAPNAFRVPISLVRSTTDVYKVVTVPTAPTTNDIIAILKRKELIPEVNSWTVCIIASTVVMPILFP